MVMVFGVAECVVVPMKNEFMIQLRVYFTPWVCMRFMWVSIYQIKIVERRPNVTTTTHQPTSA